LAPEKYDLVLLFKADITDQVDWKTNDEIDQVAFFHKDHLPRELHPWNQKRINDAYQII
jgi:8-oxo-dGTP diphosphatase